MGRLAEGDAFFDREEVVSRAWTLLETSNLLLLAPRRVGKSSLLNQMNATGAGRCRGGGGGGFGMGVAACSFALFVWLGGGGFVGVLFYWGRF